MKKELLYFSIVIFSLIVHSCGGSYYYSEKYTCNLTSDKFIQELNEFLDETPQYKCIQTNEKGESYEKGSFYSYSANGDKVRSLVRTDSSVFYSFYIYFRDIKADVHCVINVSKGVPENNKCTIQLTGVTYSQNWAEWKTINNFKEISKEENSIIKEKFENEILNQICSK